MAGRTKSNFCCRVLVRVSARKLGAECEESSTPARLRSSPQPPDGNKPLCFPTRASWLSRRTSALPTCQSKGELSCPRGATALSASSSDLHPSCLLSGFWRFMWLCDSHPCHGKVITNSFTAHVSLDRGRKPGALLLRGSCATQIPFVFSYANAARCGRVRQELMSNDESLISQSS